MFSHNLCLNFSQPFFTTTISNSSNHIFELKHTFELVCLSMLMVIGNPAILSKKISPHSRSERHFPVVSGCNAVLLGGIIQSSLQIASILFLWDNEILGFLHRIKLFFSLPQSLHTLAIPTQCIISHEQCHLLRIENTFGRPPIYHCFKMKHRILIYHQTCE